MKELKKMATEPEELKEIINKSGYPLQLALENQINSTVSEHNFRVLSSEHRWLDKETNADGYIDLILDHKFYNIRIVIECKRIIGNWNFLISQLNPLETGKIKALSIPDNRQENINDMRWQPFDIYPESYSSSFCVLETNSKRDDRTLEKISGDLLESIEIFAKEEVLYKNKNINPREIFYIPVIVTTAMLQLCFFNPEDISLNDGKIAASIIKEQDYMRFAKSLPSKLVDADLFEDIRNADKSNSRTVFIVQARKIVEFLKKVAI